MSDKTFTEQDQKERDRVAFDILREIGVYPSMDEIDARLAGRARRWHAPAWERYGLGKPESRLGGLRPTTTEELIGRYQNLS